MAWTSRVRPWLLRKLPAGVIARPAEWFLALLCILSGSVQLASLGQSRSVMTLLGPVFYVGWCVSLVIGGLAMTCGLSSYRRAVTGWYIRRVPCYRFGLRLLGLASLTYGIAVLIAGGLNAAVAAASTLALSGMCAVRLLTLGSPR